MLEQIETLFRVWHRFRNGAVDRTGLQTEMMLIQQAIQEALHEGKGKHWYKIVTLSNELVSHWAALWTFVREEGVEPTNNRAERVLHPAVIWRKQCFDTQGADGIHFVEGILSVVTTCRQQKRNVWSFLT